MRKMISTLVLAVVFAVAQSSTLLAQTNEVKGEIKKIDKAQAKLTVKHEAIKNLDMDQMTMVFRIKDPKMLDSLNEGDQVLFEADRVNGQITITKIKKTK
jgi:Cu(I)/Ag(I) efflux system periplasmic protein CusF